MKRPKINFGEVVKFIKKFTDDGYSLSFAKARAIEKFKITKENEPLLAIHPEYVDLKTKHADKIWQEKRWVKK